MNGNLQCETICDLDFFKWAVVLVISDKSPKNILDVMMKLMQNTCTKCIEINGLLFQ